MAAIRLVSEEEEAGKVKELYEEIKAQDEIDFVPKLHRAMAANPVAVSAVNACDY